MTRLHSRAQRRRAAHAGALARLRDRSSPARERPACADHSGFAAGACVPAARRARTRPIRRRKGVTRLVSRLSDVGTVRNAPICRRPRSAKPRFAAVRAGLDRSRPAFPHRHGRAARNSGDRARFTAFRHLISPLRGQVGPFGAVWLGVKHGIVSVAPCRDPLAQRCALPTCTRERSIARRSPAWTHVICSSSASGIGSGAVISEVASSLSNWT